MVEATVLNPGNMFNSLASNRTGELSPLARSIKATLIDPQTRNAVSEGSAVRQPGFASGLPALISRPLELNAQNFLLLAAQAVTARIEVLEDEVATLRTEIQAELAERQLAAGNIAGSILTSTDFASLRESLAQSAAEDSEEGATAVSAGAARNSDARLGDFTLKPSEASAFGNSFTSLATDDTLRTQFDLRVGVYEGQQVSLADLILSGTEPTGGGQPDNFALALTGALQEDGTLADAYGTLVDNGGNEIANGTLISENDLATTFFVAGTNVRALDYLSIIQQNPGPGASPDQRGRFQTVALSTSLAPQSRTEIRDERIRDFTFFTESGTAFTSIDLAFEGVNDEGVTDILSTIQDGYVRVQVTETLSDGSENQAVVDLRESSADRLQADFAYQAAGAGVETTGLKIELRALNTDFDISGISIRAIFA